MRIVFAILLTATLIVTGCDHQPTLATQIQSAGGITVLKSECQSILDAYQKTQKEFFSSSDSLPPVIKALQPQIVQATQYGDLPVVDIQVSGGFSHHGLMVVLTNTAADFVPRKSSWKVSKIGDGVFEYRE